MKKKRIFKGIAFLLVLALLAGVGYCVFDNSRILNTKYIFASEKVPVNFDGFKIVLITDFHNGDNYEKVAEAVRLASPDIICIGGDLVSMETKDFSNTKKLLRKLTSIATVYYTYGNHEVWSTTVFDTETPKVEEELKGLGVVLLNNKVKTLEKDGQLLNLIGYGDSVYDDFDGNFEPHAVETLTKIGNTLDKSVLAVLVLHRAQYFDSISKLPYDLTLSGHLHGGQVNVKYIREYILKNHFGTDKYRKGAYFGNGHEMIISAGIALNDGLYRIFNTPEIVTVELKTK